jgi:UDP-N-acetylglucosamine 2-epimerase (non-hydrolysing)/GDP/UDP-N,N'-diacetylbacillosamine 2-epimerase (hydrolysing)
VIEAPALGTPSVDIGERQAGRDRSAGVLHCEPQAAAIAAAVRRALSPEVRRIAETCVNPYGDGHAAERIVAVLRDRLPIPGALMKRFRDLPADGPTAACGD